MRRWFAMNHPGLSAAENELCVPAKATWSMRRSQSASEPLHVPSSVEALASGSAALFPKTAVKTATAATTVTPVATARKSDWRLRRSASAGATPGGPSIASSSLEPTKTRSAAAA